MSKCAQRGTAELQQPTEQTPQRKHGCMLQITQPPKMVRMPTYHTLDAFDAKPKQSIYISSFMISTNKMYIIWILNLPNNTSHLTCVNDLNTGQKSEEPTPHYPLYQRVLMSSPSPRLFGLFFFPPFLRPGGDRRTFYASS